MDEYIVSNIWEMDDFEGFIEIKGITGDKKYTVHFLPYKEKYKGIKTGDKILGKIFINLVDLKGKTSEKLIHVFRKETSPDIEAVVQVSKIVDEYSIYAISTVIQDEILIEFEEKVNCQVGDRILIEGSLELEIE